MSRKHVFRILPVVTVASGIFFGLGLAHAGTIVDVDRLVERADDLTEHADAAVEASDGIVEALDAIVEEVDAIVEDAFALKKGGEGVFADDAMEHADELIEAGDAISEGNIALLQEVYDVLLDADEQIIAAQTAFPPLGGGKKNGVLRKAEDALDSAHVAMDKALEAVCPGGAGIFPCLNTTSGAIGLAEAADAAIHAADDAIEDSRNNILGDPTGPNPAGDLEVPVLGTIAGADAAVEAADAAVEASDAAIHAADAAIEAADKAVEKADRLVEAAGGRS